MIKLEVFRNESDVKKAIKKLLDQHNFFWWMPPMNGYGKSGVSDFLALRAGVFLAIEAKYGSNTPTTMQRGFLLSVQAESCFGFVVNETRLTWLQTWLEAFDRSIAAAGRNQEPAPEDGALMLDAIREMTSDL